MCSITCRRRCRKGQKQRTALARSLVGRPERACCSTIRCATSTPRSATRCGFELPRVLRRFESTVHLRDPGLQGGDGARRPRRRAGGRRLRARSRRRATSTTRRNSTRIARLFGDPPINLLPVRPTLGRRRDRDERGGRHGCGCRGDRAALAGRECMFGIRAEDVAVSLEPNERHPGDARGDHAGEQPPRDAARRRRRRPSCSRAARRTARWTICAAATTAWVTLDLERTRIFFDSQRRTALTDLREPSNGNAHLRQRHEGLRSGRRRAGRRSTSRCTSRTARSSRLLGSSGCGKTTTLRMVAGLESVTEGEIRIGDRVVNTLRPSERNVAMAFETYALYPPLRVRDNIAFGLLRDRVAERGDREAGEEDRRAAGDHRSARALPAVDLRRRAAARQPGARADPQRRLSICWTSRCRSSSRSCGRCCARASRTT